MLPGSNLLSGVQDHKEVYEAVPPHPPAHRDVVGQGVQGGLVCVCGTFMKQLN